MAEWGPFDVLDNLSPEDLRQRLLSLQALIDRAPIPIAIAHDPDCRFIFANRALASLIGLPEDANISLTPPPGDRPPYRIQRDGRDIPPHELRNPLAPIRSAIEVIRLARGDEELVEKARATMERQLTHLVRITDDLLDVARITQNKVHLQRERIDLRAVLQSAIEATRPMI